MTEAPTPDPEAADEARRLKRIEQEAEAMERPDRAIPLDDGEDEEGVGDLTHLVP